MGRFEWICIQCTPYVRTWVFSGQRVQCCSICTVLSTAGCDCGDDDDDDDDDGWCSPIYPRGTAGHQRQQRQQRQQQQGLSLRAGRRA